VEVLSSSQRRTVRARSSSLPAVPSAPRLPRYSPTHPTCGPPARASIHKRSGQRGAMWSRRAARRGTASIRTATSSSCPTKVTSSTATAARRSNARRQRPEPMSSRAASECGAHAARSSGSSSAIRERSAWSRTTMARSASTGDRCSSRTTLPPVSTVTATGPGWPGCRSPARASSPCRRRWHERDGYRAPQRTAAALHSTSCGHSSASARRRYARCRVSSPVSPRRAPDRIANRRSASGLRGSGNTRASQGCYAEVVFTPAGSRARASSAAGLTRRRSGGLPPRECTNANPSNAMVAANASPSLRASPAGHAASPSR
jgi:hypothetical protein